MTKIYNNDIIPSAGVPDRTREKSYWNKNINLSLFLDYGLYMASYPNMAEDQEVD